MSMVNVPLLERVQSIAPLSAVQNIYSMMDRAYEKEVIPYCQKHNIGFVAFSPIASGYLSGKVDPNQTFSGDDVRQWVPQLKKENMLANRPLLEVLSDMAARKHATNAPDLPGLDAPQVSPCGANSRLQEQGPHFGEPAPGRSPSLTESSRSWKRPWAASPSTASAAT